MKKTIILYFFYLAQISCFGQITISNNYFPNAGDSLVTTNATVQTVNNIRITKAATTTQTWDYSFLRARTATTRTIEHFRAINSRTDSALLREFPTATTVIDDTSGQIAVYRRSATRFDLLGFFNTNLGILPIGISPKFNPPSLERRAPLVFNSTNNNQTGFSLPFSTNIIPDSFLALLPIRPDSLRIRFTTNRQDKVDAFGKIRIPGSSDIDCLRERRYEITETHLDAKTGLLPIWIDITSLIPTGNFKTKDTMLTFTFWSDLYKEPLLTIQANNDSTPTAAEYKWLPLRAPTVETASNASVLIFPSPAKEAINVRLEGLASANYLLKVVDNLGRIVFTQRITASTDNIQLQINTNQWTTGVYFLNVFSEKEGIIAARRTFVIGQ